MTDKKEAAESGAPENQESPQAATRLTQPSASEPRRVRSSPAASLLAALALIVSVALGFATAYLWRQGDTVSREVALRLRKNDDQLAALEVRLRQSQETVRALQGRSAVLEEKLGDAIGQQSQLEQMYRAIVQDSLSSALAEVENSVAFAAQQLAVSGNVSGAVIAMQDADARLKRIDQPETLGLRRLITADIERLKAVPLVDVVGLALRLDTVSSGLAQLPLKAALGASTDVGATAEAGKSADGGFSFSRIADASRQGWQSLLAELSQLFRVNRIDQPETLLLAPREQYFVRENLRLRLLSARISLLSHNEKVFHADLDQVVSMMRKYYDLNARSVAGTISALEQIRGNSIATELPSLGDTLAAVRATRLARDARR